ncbi:MULTISPECIES: hypothetical protein [Sulfitobacter]|uniref:Antitoxin Xre/MbcA/ParS-like toxin-binding domain-containing protein n=1 Tax=Sulfitobacter profundi TaxID=2679961 RepID=A0ABW1Z1R5_9RHOB|nr:hypothetical protein [Sulfitobacter indolifex]
MRSDEQQTILRAIPNLFARWELTEQQSFELLSVTYKMWCRIRAGHCVALTEDQILRAGALMGIHAALRTIFADPWCYDWIQHPNGAPLFAGQPAIKVMIAGGLPTIILVRQYLEAEIAC